MKTNLKISRIPPALAHITPDHVSLSYYCRGRECMLASSRLIDGPYADIESRLAGVLNQYSSGRQRLIMILSAQLTLYSEQQLPPGLTEAQIDELFRLRLAERAGSGETETFYDYFPLKQSATCSSYGLIEARKDMLTNWVSLFEHHGLDTVAVVSEPVVLINHILNHFDPGLRRRQIVCLMPARLFIARINGQQVERIFERVMTTDIVSGKSIISDIHGHLAADDRKAAVPTLVFDAIDCGVADDPAAQLKVIREGKKEMVPGENTFKWLRANHDFYQSAALA